MATAKTKKVKILCANAAGKYLLPYSEGAIAPINTKQADEMIANGDAELVKKPDAKKTT